MRSNSSSHRAWAGGEAPAGNASARGQLQLNGKISVKEKTIPQRFICEKGLGAKISCASDWTEYNGKCYKVRRTGGTSKNTQLRL